MLRSAEQANAKHRGAESKQEEAVRTRDPVGDAVRGVHMNERVERSQEPKEARIRTKENCPEDVQCKPHGPGERHPHDRRHFPDRYHGVSQAREQGEAVEERERREDLNRMAG